MSKNLTKYRLKAKCNGLTFINLSKNKGDATMRYKIASLTDQQAARLLSRKDGRGAEYVEPIPAEPAGKAEDKTKSSTTAKK